jgi:undecaprenyl-diphosphatase
MLEKILQWDREALIYLNGFGIEKYDGFWLIVTDFRTWIPLFIALILLIFLKYSRRDAVLVLLSYLIMLLLLAATIFLTKDWIGRLRPNNDQGLNLLIRIVHMPSDFSFFSGHSTISFGITTLTVLLLGKKFAWINLIWIYPLLFSFSRIYLGVHFPSDILVGALVGVFFAWAVYRMLKKFKSNSG